jgi:hypothetical protein
MPETERARARAGSGSGNDLGPEEKQEQKQQGRQQAHSRRPCLPPRHSGSSGLVASCQPARALLCLWPHFLRRAASLPPRLAPCLCLLRGLVVAHLLPLLHPSPLQQRARHGRVSRAETQREQREQREQHPQSPTLSGGRDHRPTHEHSTTGRLRQHSANTSWPRGLAYVHHCTLAWIREASSRHCLSRHGAVGKAKKERVPGTRGGGRRRS